MIFVVRDYLVRHFKDVLGAAVVLFQLHHFHIVVIPFKLQDIFNRCTAETVNALCIIAHHTHILVHGAEQLDDFVLRRIRILVLIDHDVAKLSLVFAEGIGMVLQQFVHAEE